MLKAVIVEDEKNSQELLKEMVTEYCEGVEIIDIAGNVRNGVDALNSYKPDLVFLDIELPDGDGFQVLEKTEHSNFEVIFTTAYDQYAMKAFKFSATDYLLKPVDIDELQDAVARVVEKRTSDEPVDQSEKIAALIENIRSMNKPLKRIVLPTTHGFTVVNPDDILRCESDRNYTFIFLTDKRRILVSRTIKEYDEMLRDYNFFRIHQSHLINLKYLKNYTRGRGGYVELTDGSQLDVSARRKSEFLKRMAADS
ncbi:LytTR family DNA-binding domain-containing protein [Pontibacter sp. G13]|uniref:LytR/AlgR family response regulator transcription factor n=1 Tax=Pontibacter sp. G13 TaxID=3074898 RepID=UPI00288A04A5|nr:LytTR family DNA-binding domain-containing protein [Pontibacter sp. G13]WNJ16835.1 LytTR family DNA-binding domain-containing protein [Pontibacter sp. G13]